MIFVEGGMLSAGLGGISPSFKKWCPRRIGRTARAGLQELGGAFGRVWGIEPSLSIGGWGGGALRRGAFGRGVVCRSTCIHILI